MMLLLLFQLSNIFVSVVKLMRRRVVKLPLFLNPFHLNFKPFFAIISFLLENFL